MIKIHNSSRLMYMVFISKTGSKLFHHISELLALEYF